VGAPPSRSVLDIDYREYRCGGSRNDIGRFLEQNKELRERERERERERSKKHLHKSERKVGPKATCFKLVTQIQSPITELADSQKIQ
jgi:hypothetical protein